MSRSRRPLSGEFAGPVIGGPMSGAWLQHDRREKRLVVSEMEMLPSATNDIEMKHRFGEYVWNPRNGTWNWKDL